MNRIEETFLELKKENKKALITFVTAGDPNLEQTAEYILGMAEAGADIIEIGIPFSDPVADGPVIQAANLRAFQNKITVLDIMQMVGKVREKIQTPLLYLMYFNTLLQYGVEQFFSDCKQYGIDGVIIPDLPFEESEEISEIADHYDIIRITLVAPTSKERLSKITQSARGFLYCISSLGVTGTRSEISTDLKNFVDEISAVSNLPKAVGFGISSKEQIVKLKNLFDGFIVGSAIVDKIGKGEEIKTFITELKSVL